MNGTSAAAPLFTSSTKAIVWGLQSRAIQSMLDFDFVCERSSPSVVAVTYPMTGDHKQKFYWGQKEILIPVYKQMKDAFEKHPTASVLVSFASLRSAFDSTMEALQFPQVSSELFPCEGPSDGECAVRSVRSRSSLRGSRRTRRGC